MNVKIFSLDQEKEANEFIKSVVLVDDAGLQVAGENIVIFYKSTKDEYKEHFLSLMVESLKRNMFHEIVRKVSAEAEIAHYKEHGGKSEKFDAALKNDREAGDNIETFKAKLAALEGWKAANTSNE